MAINLTDYFTKMGKLFHYANTTITAVGTTVEDEVEDFVQQFTTESLEIKSTAEGTRDLLAAFQSSGSSFLSSSMQTFANNFLIETVKADNPQVADSLDTSIDELRAQMLSQSETLDASIPTCTPSYGGSNTGDGVIVTSVKRGDGLTNEFIFAETVTGEITSVASNGTATCRITGQAGENNAFSHLWPRGSAIDVRVTSLTAGGGNNLLTNGGFETVDSVESDLPSGWTAPVATHGTTLKVSDVEVQTLQISGTPTAGHYLLHWTNGASDQQTTAPIAYNAASSAVQTALRRLDGLEQVTVALNTGAAPNVTHDITFVGVTNPAQLTSASFMTGGSPSITHATTTAASANVVRGARSVEIDSDGAELTTIQTPVTLAAATQYAVNVTMKVDSAPVAGVITIDLVDGTGGTVIADDQSTNNSFTVDVTALTTTWSHETAVFRTPTNLPGTAYFRIRVSTAISNTSSVFVDEAILAPMTSLYTGGVSVALFSGATDWVVGDDLTLTVANGREGALHEWMDRVYGLRERGVLLPTDSAGSETIADTLIS